MTPVQNCPDHDPTWRNFISYLSTVVHQRPEVRDIGSTKVSGVNAKIRMLRVLSTSIQLHECMMSVGGGRDERRKGHRVHKHASANRHQQRDRRTSDMHWRDRLDSGPMSNECCCWSHVSLIQYLTIWSMDPRGRATTCGCICMCRYARDWVYMSVFLDTDSAGLLVFMFKCSLSTHVLCTRMCICVCLCVYRLCPCIHVCLQVCFWVYTCTCFCFLCICVCLQVCVSVYLRLFVTECVFNCTCLWRLYLHVLVFVYLHLLVFVCICINVVCLYVHRFTYAHIWMLMCLLAIVCMYARVYEGVQ